MSVPQMLTTQDAEMINTALNFFLDCLKDGVIKISNEEKSEIITVEYIQDLIDRMTH